jgi:hypothetical protein
MEAGFDGVEEGVGRARPSEAMAAVGVWGRLIDPPRLGISVATTTTGGGTPGLSIACLVGRPRGGGWHRGGGRPSRLASPATGG